MRATVLTVIFFTLLFFSGCGNAEKKDQTNDDAYGEYEIAEPDKPKSKVHVVEIREMKFVPEILHVRKGDTVVWINRDLLKHDVTETTKNLWTSSPLTAGVSWKKQFTESQQYHCSLHMVMTGKVIVDGNDIAMSDARPPITICKTSTAKIALN